MMFDQTLLAGDALAAGNAIRQVVYALSQLLGLAAMGRAGWAMYKSGDARFAQAGDGWKIFILFLSGIFLYYMEDAWALVRNTFPNLS
ncbi:hypothetical protein KIF53_13860 [Chromobacterium subtsugae]|uniref:Uncharacterized protein n=2 Tax=Chromobacterium subtsugae TaxID=251747 RepID=A0ABS7FFF5_9NEIS|nr:MULTISPECIES: hypothetical protein [Chromobacterium]KUM05589.1 hypothetical protein Cv017_08235 [Chromobacterium subtsugae]KZE87659.1 hypothetical protein AWB61_10775 [Chromobacterium sp. F49]MBW8288716.1 hypothetical protein [Chromobacterium subtsugae]OBU85756.1 hypothetical protein MY55_14265 [Chromobacterium subtsugae]WSE90059.1 hypothetical protein U6115_14300 [Chromobacterium subtsugae]